MDMCTSRLIVFSTIILACSMFAACTDNTEETKSVTTDSISLLKGIDTYGSWDVFSNPEGISFSLDSLSQIDNIKGELFTQPFEPDADFYKCYGKLLVYNADSSIFIDGYSNNWIIEEHEDGMLYARAGEVDIEVAVVNTRSNVRTRLFFCGPSCILKMVFWHSEDIVGIMGYMTENNDEQYKPIIWFVNIHNGVTMPYLDQSSIGSASPNDFSKKYMESKGIKVQY